MLPIPRTGNGKEGGARFAFSYVYWCTWLEVPGPVVDKLTKLKTTENLHTLKNGECCEAQRGGRPAELESEGEWKAELP